MKNEYINIKAIAQAKDLKSTRSIRMEINKPESKYISRAGRVGKAGSGSHPTFLIIVKFCNYMLEKFLIRYYCI